MEIKTTRDIARQILRHRSFTFQEFSQRYAEVFEPPEMTDVRLQDTKNRQNSFSTTDGQKHHDWNSAQRNVWNYAKAAYSEALRNGVAKEVARKLLPEGLTRSTLYMTGSLRSWIHYTELRCGNGTQKEHVDIAQKCRKILDQLLTTNQEGQ